MYLCPERDSPTRLCTIYRYVLKIQVDLLKFTSDILPVVQGVSIRGLGGRGGSDLCWWGERAGEGEGAPGGGGGPGLPPLQPRHKGRQNSITTLANCIEIGL